MSSLFSVRRALAFFLSTLLFSSTLSAQDLEPADDPTLRLPGEKITSVTGGMPSTGVRALVDDERDLPFTHALSVDPVLTFASVNMAYDRRIGGYLVLGGRIALPIGIRTIGGETGSVWGAGAEARLFPYGTGPKGIFVRLALTHYTGDYKVDLGPGQPEFQDFGLSSFVGDIGWRWMMNKRVSFDFMFGLERFSSGADSLLADVPFVAPRFREDTSTQQVHVSTRFGYAW